MDALAKAILLRNSPTDISNYKDKIIETLGHETIKYDSISLFHVQRYLHILKQNSQVISMDKRYYMRPDYVSYDFYGTTNLTFIILLANNCMSMFDFIQDEIIVPDIDVISAVLSKIKNQVREVTIHDF